MTEGLATAAQTGSIAVQLRRAEAAVRERLQPVLDEHGLSLEHWRILAVVEDTPGLGMSDVGAEAVVPAASMTRHMDKLVEHGLVVRRVDPADRRRAVVALSARGQRLAGRLRRAEGAVVLPEGPHPAAVAAAPQSGSR
ncbi:MarR family winged helix-turn-helix transcriptional regulator [Nocardioides sp. cx-173]|uniref:MarR family winged helix-turn-helix transcriptional regulator n=1 Tax=Nocardioides sp. cx-173 TaxID=2898796 RepID=UPI001E3121B9|nr:MarR family transcriptional regulator [Nocardioides sp. cx-173]MCD4524812.1 MarR family transcriptional regulator [Nocardioides sp. cx-173]UGB43318.1 MarR family transcriptional regulator [Nocardioides sp. cx-173]